MRLAGAFSPIIVAALPISKSMDAGNLLLLLKKVLDGLHSRGIAVVSYACDGTGVERAVQKRFLDQFTSKHQYVIKNLRPGRRDTTITYNLFQGQAGFKTRLENAPQQSIPALASLFLENLHPCFPMLHLPRKVLVHLYSIATWRRSIARTTMLLLDFSRRTHV
jgi:hypothetical protein